jgi:hypothetical protein
MTAVSAADMLPLAEAPPRGDESGTESDEDDRLRRHAAAREAKPASFVAPRGKHRTSLRPPGDAASATRAARRAAASSGAMASSFPYLP